MEPYIKKFNEINMADIAAADGKNPSRVNVFKTFHKGIPVPDGFATTAFVFEKFLIHNSLHSLLYD
jgi:pyruvate,water dikinase